MAKTGDLMRNVSNKEGVQCGYCSLLQFFQTETGCSVGRPVLRVEDQLQAFGVDTARLR